jgi:hypothetical protein
VPPIDWPRCRIDELARDAHAVSGLAQAAFQHIAHAEFPANLLHVNGTAFVGEARIARDDESSNLTTRVM